MAPTSVNGHKVCHLVAIASSVSSCLFILLWFTFTTFIVSVACLPTFFCLLTVTSSSHQSTLVPSFFLRDFFSANLKTIWSTFSVTTTYSSFNAFPFCHTLSSVCYLNFISLASRLGPYPLFMCNLFVIYLHVASCWTHRLLNRFQHFFSLSLQISPLSPYRQ